MKVRFESNFDVQLRAIEAVADWLRGQEMPRMEFTATIPRPIH